MPRAGLVSRICADEMAENKPMPEVGTELWYKDSLSEQVRDLMFTTSRISENKLEITRLKKLLAQIPVRVEDLTNTLEQVQRFRDRVTSVGKDSTLPATAFEVEYFDLPDRVFVVHLNLQLRAEWAVKLQQQHLDAKEKQVKELESNIQRLEEHNAMLEFNGMHTKYTMEILKAKCPSLSGEPDMEARIQSDHYPVYE